MCKPALNIRYPNQPLSNDMDIFIDLEGYDEDDGVAAQFIQYTTFKKGPSFVSFNDDAGVETTFLVTDIDEIIEALEEVKRHHSLFGGTT